MSHEKVPLLGSGKYAKPLTDEEKQRDDVGFTHPNLHRRVDSKDPADYPEKSPRDYKLSIQGLYSLRTTIKNTHDEESNEEEIP